MGSAEFQYGNSILKTVKASFFVVIAWAGMICAPADARTVVDESFIVAEKDFATPGAALSHFVESVKANDLTAALQSFAVNDYAAQYDFKAYSMRMGVIYPMIQNAPSDYAMFEQLNRLELLSQHGGAIRNFIYSFNATIPVDMLSRVTSPDEIDAFVAAVDPSRLAGLSVAEAHVLAPNSPTAIMVMKEQIAPIGADESVEMFILYELDGRYFSGGARLLRYGDAWKIEALSSAFADTLAYAGVSPTSREEFAAKIEELREAGNVLPEKIVP
jgi:hypothetical protein